jgi:hypothetical protein
MDWSASPWIAIGFALLAAICTAAAIAVRQRAIQDKSSGRRPSGAIVTSWVRDPIWWVGTGAAVAGFAFQALALATGSLLLVQPLLVSALLFVRHWTLLVGRPRESSGQHPGPTAWTVVFAVAPPLVIGCRLHRPDVPRLREGEGKPVKYEAPWQQRNGLDITSGVGPMLTDPSVPLFITEG